MYAQAFSDLFAGLLFLGGVAGGVCVVIIWMVSAWIGPDEKVIDRIYFDIEGKPYALVEVPKRCAFKDGEVTDYMAELGTYEWMHNCTLHDLRNAD